MEERSPISYSFEDIKRYKQGLMSKEEMHAFEKASMEDPFLADALEGYMQADINIAEKHLSNIHDRVSNKEQEKEKAVVVSMPKKSFGMWRVAAMVIIIAGAGLITYKVFNKKEVDPGTGTIAQVQEQKTTPSAQPGIVLPADTNVSKGTIDIKDSPSLGVSSAPKNQDANTRDYRFTEEKKKTEQKDALRDVARKEDRQSSLNSRQEHDTKLENDAKEFSKEPITNRASAAPNIALNEIRGTILTPSNEPLANTNLRINNPRREVKTDDAGNFVLNSKDSVVNAVVTSGSYANSQVQLRANSTSTLDIGTIQLKTDPDIKLDIEVIGLGAKKKAQDTSSVKPEGGWMSFKQHIAKWLSNPADTSAWDNPQEFEMEFYVDAKGFAKDVKVVNGVNAVIGEQIIEAIRQGPKWVARNRKTRLLIRL
jgi:hypothetical protein